MRQGENRPDYPTQDEIIEALLKELEASAWNGYLMHVGYRLGINSGLPAEVLIPAIKELTRRAHQQDNSEILRRLDEIAEYLHLEREG